MIGWDLVTGYEPVEHRRAGLGPEGGLHMPAHSTKWAVEPKRNLSGARSHGIDEALELIHADHVRLLYVHVLASSQGLNRVLGVRRVVGCDVDEVDIGVFQDPLRVRCVVSG